MLARWLFLLATSALVSSTAAIARLLPARLGQKQVSSAAGVLPHDLQAAYVGQSQSFSRQEGFDMMDVDFDQGRRRFDQSPVPEPLLLQRCLVPVRAQRSPRALSCVHEVLAQATAVLSRVVNRSKPSVRF